MDCSCLDGKASPVVFHVNPSIVLDRIPSSDAQIASQAIGISWGIVLVVARSSINLPRSSETMLQLFS